MPETERERERGVMKVNMVKIEKQPLKQMLVFSLVTQTED